MRAFYLIIILTVVFLIGISVAILKSQNSDQFYTNSIVDTTWWEIQSIDAVKYSRDLAREKAKDETFDAVIEKQVSLIASAGATHIGIGTPYDAEFLPFMKRWVLAARKYGLKVWFRGNLAGWEGWFGYKKITRQEHIARTKEFILANGELFEDGDIFSACPECENGGSGDPRHTGDIGGHRKFLIDEYKITNDSFRKIGKNVRSNFIPMNGDVAKLIMDKETTKTLGGVVVIDHYVKDPGQLLRDINSISQTSGGKVVLGEFGAPIPDIHGNLTEKEQADWLGGSLTELSGKPQLIGVNYWVGFGGTTALWKDDYSQKKAVDVLRKYFKPKVLSGKVIDEIGKPIKGADVSIGAKMATTQSDGTFILPYLSDEDLLQIKVPGYIGVSEKIGGRKEAEVVLKKSREDFIFKIRKFLFNFIRLRRKPWA